MKTRITELFGIKHPIMMAGMNMVTEPQLVSAVSNAGGLGILAISSLTTDEVSKEVRKIKELTDKPFGVNLVLNRPSARENLKIVVEAKVPVVNYAIDTAATLALLI